MSPQRLALGDVRGVSQILRMETLVLLWIMGCGVTGGTSRSESVKCAKSVRLSQHALITFD